MSSPARGPQTPTRPLANGPPRFCQDPTNAVSRIEANRQRARESHFAGIDGLGSLSERVRASLIPAARGSLAPVKGWRGRLASLGGLASRPDAGVGKPCVCVQRRCELSPRPTTPQDETARQRRACSHTHGPKPPRLSPTPHYTYTYCNSTVTFYPQNVTVRNILAVAEVPARV